MPNQLRWGILGTGNIAGQFCAGMATAPRGNVVAVGSRSGETARAFAERFQLERAHGTYEALLADPGVDAIYLSLPNTMHHEWTIRALRAGKHVLCEKPFAMNAAQAREMFDEADRAGKVLVEAFMYLSHPQTMEVLGAVRSGAIGQVQLVRTSFCFRIRKTEGNIRFRPDLGGGALMDVGCYCTNLACLIADDDPVELHATAKMHPAGVDEQTAGVLRFGNGMLSSFSCGMNVQADNTAWICGTEGYIEIPVPWKPPTSGARWTVAHSTPPKQDLPKGSTATAPPRQSHTVEAGKDLYALEADDFAASVLDGKPPRVPRELTLRNTRILESLRRNIGLSY